METRRLFKAILGCDSGATAIEYGLIAALIVIAMMAAMNSFADSAIGMWEFVAGKVETPQ